MGRRCAKASGTLEKDAPVKQGLVIDVSSVPPRPAGAGRYAIELVSNLATMARGFELVAKADDALHWRDISSANVALRSPNSAPLRIAWERLVLGRRLNLRGQGVYHGIHYAIPSSYRGTKISTVHDLTMIEHPEWHEQVKVVHFSRAIRIAVEIADAIIVPSEFTKSRLEAQFGRLDKVSVIYHGVDHAKFRPESASHKSNGSNERRWLQGARVILHVGTIEPRKNLVNLVKAFDILAGEDHDAILVLAGQKGWKHEEVYKSVNSAKYRDRIHEIGYISECELLELMRQASCIAYPSFAEGFGLPVLEAMAAGVPVVTSAGSVMEEVAGGCAWLCDALDPSDIAEKLNLAISGSHEVESKVAQGVLRSQEFNWSDSARKHLKVYQALGFEYEG